VGFEIGLKGMVVPYLENPTSKSAKVGKKIAAHDFYKWLFRASLISALKNFKIVNISI